MHAQALTFDHLAAPDPTPVQRFATVAEADDGQLIIELEGRRQPARRAASCLLSPGPGDRVWVVGDPGEGLFVLAVLERADPSLARIDVEGELALRASGPLRLSSPQLLTLRSQSFELDAQSATCTLTELRAIASRVFTSFARATRVGQVLELLVDTVRQRSETSLRVIAGLDHSEADTVHQQVRGDLHINSRRALVNGGEIVKLDGDQIHLG